MMQNWYEYVQSQPERILCAAILRKEIRKTISNPYHKGTNQICDLEIGYRHHDIMQRFNDELIKSPYGQGFYTSKGRFVGRHEAMYIAYKAKQVPKEIASSETEKSFVDFMNDMILGEFVTEPETPDNLLICKEREDYYHKLGYNQLLWKQKQ